MSVLLCDLAVASVRPLLSRHLQHLCLDPLLATSHPHLRLVWQLCVLDRMTCVVVRRVRRVSGVWMVLSCRLDSSSRRSLVSSDSSFGLTGGLRTLWDPLQGRLGHLRHFPTLRRQCYHNVQQMWCSGGVSDTEQYDCLICMPNMPRVVELKFFCPRGARLSWLP